MTNFKILKKISPISLNGELIIETPMEFERPFAFYEKESDSIVIGYEPIEMHKIQGMYITFPTTEVSGSSIKRINTTRNSWYDNRDGSRTFGNIYGLSSDNVDDNMLYVRTCEHIGEYLNLVTGGNLFHISSVKVFVERVVRWGQGDGGHSFQLKVESYKDLVRIQNAYPKHIKLSSEELCFESKSNMILSKLCKTKPESNFVDCTKYD